MGKFIIFLLCTSAMVGIGYYAWTRQSPAQGGQLIDERADFSEEGNLTRGNPGVTSDAWHLTYEEPGKPALTIPLSFTTTTVCIHEDLAMPCTSSGFPLGERVSVVGKKTEAGVDVWAMTYLAPQKNQ